MQNTENDDLSMTSTSTHAMGDEPNVLNKVMKPDVNLALWQRPPEPEIIREVSILQASDLQDVRRSTSLTSFNDDVRALFQQQGLDPLDFRNLRADMNKLAGLLGNLSRCSHFTFRLVTIAGDECRRFHLDRTPLRLICTYQGPGTEWLAEWQVNRAALATSAANDAIIRSGKPSRFEHFWVGVFKGDPGRLGQGLVHRSPPVAGSGQIRVLFCLDCEIMSDPGRAGRQ